MNRCLRSILLIISVALPLPLSGCGQSGDSRGGSTGQTAAPAPDPHDVPITESDVSMPASYAEAIPRIQSYRDAIRGAIEAGTPSKAHRPLDELDIVLNKLPSIAKGSDIPKEQWETINSSAQELRGLFNQLHSAIDDQKQPDYNAVAERIDQAITKLERVKQ